MHELVYSSFLFYFPNLVFDQLADDTTLFCNSKEDVLKAMNEIEIVGSFSGLLLNRNKTEGALLGQCEKCYYDTVILKQQFISTHLL
jgi:hypothetical protein